MVENLHIQRQDAEGNLTAITLEEWAEAVGRIDGIRMATGDAAAANPLTEDVVTLPNRGGDAEVYRQDCQTWMRTMFWTPEGTIRFAAPESKDDTILPLAGKLARELDAGIYDESGKAHA
ncbi:hypothetical protein [Novosphingobium malaysiense]|uniref:Uncharacterized protein n=1 Tax=Novosphingobium malaysiense TaxID=1348853 RepID=A0A0B1ZR74_9SPHN|nr:hypothetical protein [Novosphingobium malaysiense]KHK91743.1 hypothetical protein LK12_13310 [Novosphingobium malaysiense]